MFGKKTESSGWREAATHSCVRRFPFIELLVLFVRRIIGVNDEKQCFRASRIHGKNGWDKSLFFLALPLTPALSPMTQKCLRRSVDRCNYGSNL